MTIAELYDALESFDWYFAMSDDHGVWRRGQARQKEILSAADELGDAGRDLYLAWYGHVFSGVSYGTSKLPKPERPS